MQSVNEIRPVYIMLQKKKALSKNSTKTATWKLVPGPFVFLKNLAQSQLEYQIFKASYLC